MGRLQGLEVSERCECVDPLSQLLFWFSKQLIFFYATSLTNNFTVNKSSHLLSLHWVTH